MSLPMQFVLWCAAVLWLEECIFITPYIRKHPEVSIERPIGQIIMIEHNYAAFGRGCQVPWREEDICWPAQLRGRTTALVQVEEKQAMFCEVIHRQVAHDQVMAGR